MLIIYKAIQGDLVFPDSHERAEKILFAETEPQIQDRISMGESRLWEVIQIDRYHSEDDMALLAIVIPQGMSVPDKAEWSGIYWPQYPNRTLAVAVQPNREIITYEFHMDGSPMSGRIETATTSDNQPQLVASDWVVQSIVTYKAPSPSAYAAISCCECVHSPQPAIAV
jgi:hypothetical protein